jgi:hypothetical protein
MGGFDANKQQIREGGEEQIKRGKTREHEIKRRQNKRIHDKRTDTRQNKTKRRDNRKRKRQTQIYADESVDAILL